MCFAGIAVGMLARTTAAWEGICPLSCSDALGEMVPRFRSLGKKVSRQQLKHVLAEIDTDSEPEQAPVTELAKALGTLRIRCPGFGLRADRLRQFSAGHCGKNVSCQDGNGEIEFEELCMLEIKMSGARPRADLIDAGLALRTAELYADHRTCYHLGFSGVLVNGAQDYREFLTERQVAKLETAFLRNDRKNTGAIIAGLCQVI